MPEAKDSPPQPARFKCLRCGSEFMLPYTPGKIEERSCPHCESNSVRRLKTAPAKPAPPAGNGLAGDARHPDTLSRSCGGIVVSGVRHEAQERP